MTVAAILGKALRWQAVLTLVVVVIGGVIAWFVAELPGVIGVVLGGVLAVVFMGLTGVSILIGNRVTRQQPGDVVVFFAIVLGGWLAKFVIFIIVGLLLRGADWLVPQAFGLTAIVVVAGSLLIDGFAVARSRMPAIDVQLPIFQDTPDVAPAATAEGPEMPETPGLSETK